MVEANTMPKSPKFCAQRKPFVFVVTSGRMNFQPGREQIFPP
jgi:hypothetical protein